MKFTITPPQMESLVKAACSARAKKKDQLTITAFDNRLSVGCNGVTANSEVEVSMNGSVTVHAKSFRKVLDTFNGASSLEFEGNAEGLRIQNFPMGVISYDPKSNQPAS